MGIESGAFARTTASIAHNIRSPTMLADEIRFDRLGKRLEKVRDDARTVRSSLAAMHFDESVPHHSIWGIAELPDESAIALEGAFRLVESQIIQAKR